MFRKLDRYLARSFVEPFLVATAVIVGLYTVADAFSNLDDYLRASGRVIEALSRMAQIYLLRIPAFLAPILPFSMLVGAAYGISRLSGRNEISAMKASGLSFWHILGPVYAMAAAVALLGFANHELLVPKVEQMAAPNVQVWEGRGDRYERVVDYLEEEGTLYSLMYNVAKRHARSVSLFKRLPDGKTSHIIAGEAKPAPDGWILRQMRGQEGEYFWRTRLRSRDLEVRLLPPNARPLAVLRRLIRNAEREKNEGERRTYLFDYHGRLAYPFTGIVLVALGMPFVIGHEKLQRSRMLGIGVCVVICMVFYTVQFIVKDLGHTGHLPPAVAAWLPNIIFGGLALYLLETVHE